MLKFVIWITLLVIFAVSQDLETFKCGENEESSKRILILSTGQFYFYDRLLKNATRSIIPTQKSNERLLKTLHHLITVNGNLDTVNNECITLVESPQVFSHSEVLEFSFEASRRCFHNVLVTIQTNGGGTPLGSLESEILISQLQLLGSTFGDTFWDKLAFLFYSPEETSVHLIRKDHKGKDCIGVCSQQDGSTYHHCRNSEGSWGYCSPIQNLTSRGEKCKSFNPCGLHGDNYHWCFIESEGWDYCSPPPSLGIGPRHADIFGNFCIDQCKRNDPDSSSTCTSSFSHTFEHCSTTEGTTIDGDNCIDDCEIRESKEYQCNTEGNELKLCGIVEEAADKYIIKEHLQTWINKLIGREIPSEKIFIETLLNIGDDFKSFIVDNIANDLCTSCLAQNDLHVFKENGIPWMGFPFALSVPREIASIKLECYIMADQVEKDDIVVTWDDEEITNGTQIFITAMAYGMKSISIHLDSNTLQASGEVKCLYKGQTSINYVTITTSEENSFWGSWSNWVQCHNIDSNTSRYRTVQYNNGESSRLFEKQTRQCRCSDLEELPKPRILLIGQTGVGKSTFGNQLFGGYEIFAKGHKLSSKTDEISVVASNFVGTSICMTIIDTPGALDTKGRDYENSLKMRKLLKNDIKTVDSIVLLLDGQNPRFHAATVELIKWYEVIFGKEMWQNVIVEVTFWQHTLEAETARWSERRVTEESFSEELQTVLKRNFDIPNEIIVPVVFIDPSGQFFDDPCSENYVEPEKGEIDKFFINMWRFLEVTETGPPYTCKDLCQASDGFFTGSPKVYNLPNSELFLEPGNEKQVEWQIWEGLKNYSASFKILLDDELLYEKNFGESTQSSRKNVDGFNFQIQEVNLHQKITSIRLTVMVSTNFTSSSLNRSVSIQTVGEESESESVVNVFVVKDAKLMPWSSWSTCSKSCLSVTKEYGIRTRKRNCIPEVNNGKSCSKLLEDPSIPPLQPAVLTESKFCIGETTETIVCPNSVTWSPWSEWAKCSKTCSGGTSERTRLCRDGKDNGDLCTVSSQSESKACNNDVECPRNCLLSSWQPWSQCSSTCNGLSNNGTYLMSTRSRQKKIIIEGNSFGQTCESLITEETKFCPVPQCPVDGVWSDWTEESPCPTYCGQHTKIEERVCIGPYYNGIPCIGPKLRKISCPTIPCQVQCEWEEWRDWGSCSSSCGSGTRSRSRIPKDPTPGIVYKSCNQKYNDTEHCYLKNCPVNGYWSDWFEGSECSTSCGHGTKMRYRYCIGPFDNGEPCKGFDKELVNCELDECGDGKWSPWKIEGECSTKCGPGTQKVTRTCLTRTTCLGKAESFFTCEVRPCTKK